MIVFTDNLQFAEQYLADNLNWRIVTLSKLEENVGLLINHLLPQKEIYQAVVASTPLWQYLFLVEYAAGSQFDILVKLAQKNTRLPCGVLCLAGAGKKFHGFKNRPWVSLAGNVHLSVFFAPYQKIEYFGVAFTILAAVSVLQALDSITGLEKKAMVKWVNDIFISKAKVCGVLAHTQTQGKLVTAACLGIGINVETRPQVASTPFVPKVAALCDFSKNAKLCHCALVFQRLVHFLDQNYRSLISGHFSELLEFYRQRSLVIGKKVKIFADTPAEQAEEIMRGKVQAIGENLELIFEGVETPLFKGRLVIEESRIEPSALKRK
ncbi:MAG: biotin--[acetyl-CoA-carboxylase] ligase [bacterium]